MLINFDVRVDQKELIDAEKGAKRLIDTFKEVAAVASVALGFRLAGVIAEQSDIYETLANKLRVVTKTSEEFASAQRGVFDIARATFSPVEDVTGLFQRFANATHNLGSSQEEVLDFTKRVTQATKLSGATAEETHGALIQLSQGLANGFGSAGQEIRSLEEQAPMLANIIAKAAGGGEGELMKLYKQGKITSKLVFDSVRAAGPELDKLFKKRVPLFADLKTNVWNDWVLLLKQLSPMFDKIKVGLGGVVDWIHRWVEDGSAMNSVIAGLILGVTALSIAFAPFVAQLLLSIAPFALLFLMIEDFVTFMRGGKSLLGDALGPDASKRAREGIGSLVDSLGVLKDFLSGKMTNEQFDAQFLKVSAAFVKMIDFQVDYAKKKFAELGMFMADKMTFGILGTKDVSGPQHMSAEEREQLKKDSPIANFLSNLMFSDEEKEGIRQRGLEREAAFNGAGGGVMSPDLSYMPPVPSLAPNMSSVVNQSSASAPDQRTQTVNVTVQGSATASTARDVANATMSSVADMGRDRSAIMSSMPGAQ